MKKILLIDDDDDVLEVVREALTSQNYKVRCYDCSAGFISIVEKFRPDLILLDFKLQDGNGGDVCLALKQHPKHSQVPVVIMTAYSNPNLDFSRFRCNAVIDKPFDLYNLFDVVKHWTKPCSMQMPLDSQ
jgi:DNA-binding response OmpR family regulator